MNEAVAIWNTLHDGEITVVEMLDDTLTIFINVPYIRERIRPLGDSFVLKLHGFRAIRLFDYEGKLQFEDWRELARREIEILSTDSTEMPVRINTTQGLLALDFDRLQIQLDTGGDIPYSNVIAACESYWEEWASKYKNETSEQGGGADSRK